MTNRALVPGLAVLLALASGCTGELVPFDPLVGGGGPPAAVNDPLAQQIFSQQVQPILNAPRARGACSVCHQGTDSINGPDFMGVTAVDNFNAILSWPAARGLVVPGNPNASKLQNYPVHSGDALLPAEADTIANWIVMLQ